MNPKILHTTIQEYIFNTSESNIDLTRFILAGSAFDHITIQELAQQINGRIKAKNKLPIWYATKYIYYPPNLNLEQTSSAITAFYKSTLVSGEVLVDLTGGFGVDDYYFSKKITTVIHCEVNFELSTIASHNFEALAAKNIQTYTGDGLEILQDFDTIDWIYIDPSRRNDNKGKVFFLEDCIPDVPANKELLFRKSSHILLKTSPLLDIHAGIHSLVNVKEIHIVAVDNEVKELLWVLEKGVKNDIVIHTINFTKNTSVQFSFILPEESKILPKYSLPKKYLYEPNASILKSGGFSSIAKTYEVEKLHPHSHIYTSDRIIDFPGRRFMIQQILPYKKQLLKKENITKANITTRNFPESVAEIRKKYKIKDGGDMYLFFTTNCNQEKVVLVCKKL
ncbi:class I SAM-dependent methyltransferase [Aquimarina sp. RZ0]|uniref:class I SAM-dependent methyltransferase n=1 Tax=Aquimarina sp. RZ0 TaxID=2607730 RepID=UPI0011F16970|nr:class I SAM-dependent methyltransferase [Aquimarina sp. RZ0]KAA1246904.1 class I SAM-dependent methyltransferase [Aquimarina sp. RZ0]